MIVQLAGATFFGHVGATSGDAVAPSSVTAAEAAAGAPSAQIAIAAAGIQGKRFMIRSFNTTQRQQVAGEFAGGKFPLGVCLAANSRETCAWRRTLGKPAPGGKLPGEHG
jgi:hypothetical protein